MYSFSALADTSDSHIGFWIAFICSVVIIGAAIYDALIDTNFNWGTVWVIVLCVSLVTLTYHISTNEKPPKNKQIIGKLIGYQAEGFAIQSGKIQTQHHNVYVIYEVPEGRIALYAKPGVAYPELAILYRN